MTLIGWLPQPTNPIYAGGRMCSLAPLRLVRARGLPKWTDAQSVPGAPMAAIAACQGASCANGLLEALSARDDRQPRTSVLL